MTETSIKTDAPTPEGEQPTIDKIGFDSLLDDLFGPVIRGINAIWVLLISPNKYFQAAKLPKSKYTYVPSFQIWLALVLLSALTKPIWAGKNSAMLKIYTEQMELIKGSVKAGAKNTAKPIDLSGFDPETSAMLLLKWLFILSPFVTMFLFGVFAFVYRAWGEKLSYAVRLRYVFAIIITGSALSYLAAFSTLFVKGPLFLTINNIFLIGMFLLYFWTAFKGPYAHYDTGARVAYSFVLSVICFAIVMGAIFISLFLAMIPTMIAVMP